ncbi:hypothetical protein [Xanthomonas medicagonis]|uniref:hypothetical protein n=1 Tax=Xanthomonas medicagonis TaxID=3160841 RepID=UPI0035157408
MPPPPLPVARNPMIDSMAQLSLLLGLLWVLYAVAQALLVTALPAGAIAGFLGAIELRLPPLLQWFHAHLLALSWLQVVLALGFCAASWALLRRREWARLAFVAFLVLTALANFVSLPLLWELFDALQAWLPQGVDASELQAELRTGRITAMFTAAVTCVVFVALHGWIVYLLYRPAVRAEFRN